jgi:hypothetical protein
MCEVCACVLTFSHFLQTMAWYRWMRIGGEVGREGRTDGASARRRASGASPTVAHFHWFDGDDRSIATKVTRH